MKLKEKRDMLKTKSDNMQETIERTEYTIGKFDKIVDLKVTKKEVDNEYLFYKKYIEIQKKLEVKE